MHKEAPGFYGLEKATEILILSMENKTFHNKFIKSIHNSIIPNALHELLYHN